LKSQLKSPQMHWVPQSCGHVCGLSPHWTSQLKSPQTHWLVQSWGQLATPSPHCGSQVPFPHMPQACLQSAGQVTWFSPQGTLQVPSPQTHDVCPPVPPVPWGTGPMLERPHPPVTSAITTHSSAASKIERDDRKFISTP